MHIMRALCTTGLQIRQVGCGQTSEVQQQPMNLEYR